MVTNFIVRFRAIARAAAFLAVGAVAVLPAHVSAQAAKAESADRVLFVSDRHKAGEYSIYSMKPDGSDQVRVGKGEGIAFDPAWSPDHKKIVFTQVLSKEKPSAGLAVMNADGSGVSSLVAAEEQTLYVGPSWSPNGKHLAYGSVTLGPDFAATIYVMDPDGKNRKKVTDGIAPVWSPDSLHLVYSPTPKANLPSLKMIDLDGANGKTLAAAGLGAAWSPDGKRIVYTGNSKDTPALFVMDADGTHVTKLTSDRDSMGIGPVWTADGKHILFSQSPKSAGAKPEMTIWIMEPDGKNAKPLTGKDSFVGPGASMAFIMRAAGGG